MLSCHLNIITRTKVARRRPAPHPCEVSQVSDRQTFSPCAMLFVLVQPSLCLIAGARPTYACVSRAGTPCAVGLPGKLLAAAGAGLVWWQRLRGEEKKSERFAGMEWADAPETLDGDGCEILGVEGDQGCAPPSLLAPS